MLSIYNSGERTDKQEIGRTSCTPETVLTAVLNNTSRHTCQMNLATRIWIVFQDQSNSM